MDLNKIYNMDCIEGMKLLPDNSIDMILCDLPYGTTRNKWDTVIPFDKLWGQYNRIIKDNGAIVLFSQMPFSAELVMSNAKMFRYEWMWEKNTASGFLNAKKMPLKKHENILVFYKKMPSYNPQGVVTMEKHIKTTTKSSNYGKCNGNYTQTQTNYPVDILRFNKDSERLHPTQKPVALLEYLIKTYSNEGEVVLDNCMGSGSTAVACINTGRNYIGFEVSKEYCEMAEKRIQQAGAVNG